MRTKLKFQGVFYGKGIMTEDNSISMRTAGKKSTKSVVLKGY
jgi:hypothetical protein